MPEKTQPRKIGYKSVLAGHNLDELSELVHIPPARLKSILDGVTIPMNVEQHRLTAAARAIHTEPQLSFDWRRVKYHYNMVRGKLYEI